MLILERGTESILDNIIGLEWGEGKGGRGERKGGRGEGKGGREEGRGGREEEDGERGSGEGKLIDTVIQGGA